MLHSKRNGKPQPIGLTIQLQKYSIGRLPQVNGTASRFVLGYYDNLTINVNYQWLDYSPEKLLEQNFQDDGRMDSLTTYYPIKLLFPHSGLMKEMSTFSYNAWEYPPSLLDKMPCMLLALVSLTDSYKHKVGNDLLGSFLKLIQDNVDSKLLKKVSCCVLPSIGYSDFCILMTDKQWKSSMELVEQFRNLKDDVNCAVISADYLVPAFHKGVDQLENEHFGNVQLTVRVNLEPGITAELFANYVPKGVDVFRTSGSTDCILHAKKRSSQTPLLQFLLTPAKCNNVNFVMDMASSLQLKVNTSPMALTLESPCMVDSANHAINLDCFNQAVSHYDDLLIKKNRHRRQANSLRELSNSVVNVCSQRHTEKLRQIMESFMADFASCLMQYCTQIENSDLNYDLDEAEKNLGNLCRIVNSFLTDLSRSDSFFMEQEKYSHTSVSSATSLLLAYNIWINEFTRQVQATTMNGNRSHYSFLVTSGGLDQTLTFDAFNFLEPNETEEGLFENMVLVTRMSEMGLYDLSGTIFRAAHECMHFCGMRFRKSRLHYLSKFVSSMLAKTIAQVLFPEENTYKYVEDVYRGLCPEVTPTLPSLLQSAKGSYKTWLNKFECSITDKILEFFNLDKEWTQETSYILDNVVKWMYDVLLEAFAVYNFIDEKDRPTVVTLNVLASWLYNETQQVYLGFYKSMDDLFKNQELETAVFAFEYDKQAFYIKNGLDGKVSNQDLMLHRNIQLILSRLLINLSPYALDNKASPAVYKYWKQIVPYVALISKNVQWALDVTKDTFAETFADVIACKILNVKLTEYILSHIYEDWNLDSSLPKEAPKIFRINAVLRLCFPDALDNSNQVLRQDARNSIVDAAQNLIAHGFSEKRINTEALCARVDELLKMYEEYEDTGKNLLDYLTLCINKYEQINAFNTLKPFAEWFEKIRLHNIKSDEVDTHDKLVDMYYALINVGSGRDGRYL